MAAESSELVPFRLYVTGRGVLHESLAHDCLKAYVCILYASPCAPLLVLWPGEVEGTSLAMAQGKA